MTCLDMFGVFENGVDLPKAHFNRGNHDQPLNGTVFSDKPISYILLQEENWCKCKDILAHGSPKTTVLK